MKSHDVSRTIRIGLAGAALAVLAVPGAASAQSATISGVHRSRELEDIAQREGESVGRVVEVLEVGLDAQVDG